MVVMDSRLDRKTARAIGKPLKPLCFKDFRRFFLCSVCAGQGKNKHFSALGCWYCCWYKIRAQIGGLFSDTSPACGKPLAFAVS